jgi:hypothetical protein
MTYPVPLTELPDRSGDLAPLTGNASTRGGLGTWYCAKVPLFMPINAASCMLETTYLRSREPSRYLVLGPVAEAGCLSAIWQVLRLGEILQTPGTPAATWRVSPALSE